MTWQEFKDAVERKGVKPDDEIFYIDIDGFAKDVKVAVSEPSMPGQRRKVTLTEE